MKKPNMSLDKTLEHWYRVLSQTS